MDWITVDRAELLETLSRVDPGLAPRDTIEQASCYVFRGGWLCTFNEEVCCRTKTGLPAEFEGAVPAVPLRKTLDAVTEPEVKLAMAGRELRVRVGRARVAVRRQAEILLPVDAVGRPDSWNPLPEDFKGAVEQVAPCAGTDDDEFLTVVAHVHPDYVEAADRFQGCRYDLATGADESFLVRAKSLKKTVSFDVDRMGLGDGWVHFRNSKLVISCRRYADTYPDLSRFFESSGSPLELPGGGPLALKIASLFAGDDKDDDKLTVSLSAGRMLVSGRGPKGWAEYPLECAYDGSPIEFRVGPKLLASLFERVVECQVSQTRLRVDGENWKYVAVLFKPLDPERVIAAPAAEEVTQPEPAEAT